MQQDRTNESAMLYDSDGYPMECHINPPESPTTRSLHIAVVEHIQREVSNLEHSDLYGFKAWYKFLRDQGRPE